MTSRTIELLGGRHAAERGALVAAAGGLLMLSLTAAFRPDLVLELVGPDPGPQLFAVLALAATLPGGAELGRRAARLRAEAERRRRHLIAWTSVVYLAAVTFGAGSLSVAALGPGVLADPFALVSQGLAVALLLLPWAALPVALTALALEATTRPSAARGGIGPGGGPGPGTRAPAAPVRGDEADRGRGAA